MDEARAGARARRTAALAAAVLLAIAGACGGKPERSGKELFQLQGCTLCHGKEGEGSPLGPELRGVSAHWTKATLVEYLRDPQAYQQKDERLKANLQRYRMQPMPKYGMLAPEQLEKIAEHVLDMR